MANIKSQKKRIIVAEKRNAARSAQRSDMKTAIKKVEAAVESKDKAAANEALKVAISKLDKASQMGALSENSAARKKAHLQKLVDSLD